MIDVYQHCEWKSDISILRDFIKANITFLPSTIQTEMKKLKQSFTMTQIKKVKKELDDELFPRDAEVAFHPANCKIHES